MVKLQMVIQKVVGKSVNWPHFSVALTN
jgi:hypothetical protein